MKKTIRMFAVVAIALILLGCKSVDMEKDTVPETENEIGAEKMTESEVAEEIEKLEENYMIEEELKEVDVQKTVVYIEKPMYYPVEKPKEPVKGREATQESMKEALQEPFKYTAGKTFYDYDENFQYEIYCRPYRITDLALEPGEMLLENPYLSETQVWKIGAGVSRKNGQDVQHFYLKPDCSGLVTSMIIITDRRIYNLLLKSFTETYMPMVEFEYPNKTMPYNIKTDAMVEREKERESVNSKQSGLWNTDPSCLSFDYKMTYPIFRKPQWLPKRIYDDGKKTYIQMDERVLRTKTPVLFNHKKERINYRVDKTLIIIDELIEKVTLVAKNSVNQTIAVHLRNKIFCVIINVF